MGRVSTRSNPTNLKEIDKQRITIAVSDENGKRQCSVTKLSLADLGLPGTIQVVGIARAGTTSQRFELGTVSSWRKDPVVLDDLDPSAPLRFRILLHDDSPRLQASAERIRLRDQGESESLLPMEPADLGELLWHLKIDDDGPVLQYNARVFPSAAGVENYFPFSAFVLPEALRRVMEAIADDPDKLDDENDSLYAWGKWLATLGIEKPTEEDKGVWPERVVNAFCERHRFASRLGQYLQGGTSD
jgi:hypothetical protein